MKSTSRQIAVSFLAACIFLLLSQTAMAAMLPFTSSQLVAASSRIVYAQVVSATPRLSSGPDAVVTDVTLRTLQQIKGSAAENFVLTQPGGCVGGLEVIVDDVPALTPGDSVILFLDAKGVVGGEQGRLAVESDYVSEWAMSRSACVAYLRSLATGADATGETFSAASRVPAVSTASVAIAAVPDISGMSPFSANAGVGETVTITGTDFGSSSGKVEFARGDSIAWAPVAATIVSWSSTKVVCVVPRKAQSGLVYVSTAGGTKSGGFRFHVGYSASGNKWTHDVTYLINENAAGTTGEGAAVQRAMDAWSNVGAGLKFVYGGTTDATVYQAARNGVNEIYWTSGLPAGSLGTNRTTYLNGVCLESDIYLNSSVSWGNGASLSYWDVESIVLHELGHSVGLDDQYAETDEAMGAAVKGSPRRALSAADVAGIVDLYPGGGPTVPKVTSSTHPHEASWYSAGTVQLSFTSTDPHGIAGYSTAFDNSPDTIPGTVVNGTGNTRTVVADHDGRWWFHVRAKDARGDWGETAHFAVSVDRTPPLTATSASPTYAGAASIALSASDQDAGGITTYYQLDGATGVGDKVDTTSIGDHALSYWSVDAAGNVETTRQASFIVLPVAPAAFGLRVSVPPTTSPVEAYANASGIEPSNFLIATLSEPGAGGSISAARGAEAVAPAWHTLGATWWARFTGIAAPDRWVLSIPLHPMLPKTRAEGVSILEWQNSAWVPLATTIDTTTLRASAQVAGSGPFVLAEAASIPKQATLHVEAASNLKPGYGARAKVVVKLADSAGAALGGRTVTLVASDGTFVNLVVGAGGLYSGGAPVVGWRTRFSAVFEGDGANDPTRLDVYVVPQARVTVTGPSLVGAYRSFTVTGVVRPSNGRMTGRLQAQQYSSGSYRTRISKTYTGSTSSIPVKLKLGRGTWRVRFTHSDSDHTYSASVWRTVIVR